MRRVGRFIGKIALHGRVGNEDLVDVAAVVAGILVFLFHHANHDVRETVQLDGFTDGFPGAEQLRLRFRSEDRNAARLLLIFPAVEAALFDIDRTNVCKGWQ